MTGSRRAKYTQAYKGRDMSGFLRGVFSRSAGAPTVAKISETPVPISYALSSFRWHMDTRPPAKFIAIHDYLGSCASWQQLLNEAVADLPLSRLTPKKPLEVYCADLRGHNFSEVVPMTSASSYLLASAADIINMQEDILRTEAGLVGMGFGSLVALCAALHAPDAFSSLTLFVNDISQLQRCIPSSYPVAELLRNAPADATGMEDLNNYLKAQVPDQAERAALLAVVEVQRSRTRFRFSENLLQFADPLELSASADSKFTKPTVVYLCGNDARYSREEEAALRARLPAVRLLKLDTQGESLLSRKPSIAALFLQSCDMLGEINHMPTMQ